MKDVALPPQAELRPPDVVMRLARMGQMWPTRLSFLRVVTRDLARVGTAPECRLWQMCAEGYGMAVFAVTLHGRPYSLVALTRPLEDSARSDRVIATAWDAAFVLYDGVPDDDALARIAQAAPLQEAGRFDPKVLVLSRANKSVRLWTHVVDRLRQGAQPDRALVNEIGYLMRTTAVYGNGKFGIADRHVIADRPEFAMSFAAEMLTVWLIRHFTHALVEHVAGAPLDRDIKRHLGIGNATGLGMAPFLVTHPVLLNNWMMVRETALARVRAIPQLAPDEVAALDNLHARVGHHLAQWRVPDPDAEREINALQDEWAHWAPQFDPDRLAQPHAMERLWQAGQAQSVALQEVLVAVMIEPFGSLVDGLAECLTDPYGPPPLTLTDTNALRHILKQNFDWALVVDFSARTSCQTFWYVSEDKLEPRIGNRYDTPGADRESPLDIARRIAALSRDLPEVNVPLTAFLMDHPQHLMAVERAALSVTHPYGDIRDNLIADTVRPIDMLRAKLSLFGASKFDPKSDLWTRVTLAQGAPLADELESAPDWFAPVLAP